MHYSFKTWKTKKQFTSLRINQPFNFIDDKQAHSTDFY